MKKDEQKTIVFSLAFNGYQSIYKNDIKSHKNYADKFGFDYAVINRPLVTGMLMECTWLKLVLLLSALESGYDWAFYVDSDAEIKEECPDFRTIEKSGKALYMANGFSGRVNAGVIIVQNTPEIKAFLKQTLRGFNKKLPPEDDVGWGDNGHVIHFSKNLNELEILPSVWNNNHTPEMPDYVRHYSAGPMRALHKTDFSSRLINLIWRITHKTLKKCGFWGYNPETFQDNLVGLFHKGIKNKQNMFTPISKEYIFGSPTE